MTIENLSTKCEVQKGVIRFTD